ncbi:farnesol dehydrogenase-like [Culicoides brevitarsis]|uniref:farnesol dehydrogenase-like n=1 Tax=Culicoides brevitarsis TaxID=469753 RepID=UPI00307C816B
MFPWIGKTAVVTGASSGIGAAIVLDLAKHGVNVVGLARRKDRVEALAAAHKDFKGKITAHECDVSDPKSIKKTFEWLESSVGKVHIWINNAGVWRANQLSGDKLTDEEIIEQINTNFTGLALCSRKAVKMMQKHGEESYVINIGSLAGQISGNISQAQFGTNVYAATKHAVKNLSEILWYELMSKPNNNIRVSNVSPGVVKTELGIVAGLKKEDMDKITGLISEDVSNAVNYILGTPNRVNITELTIRPRTALA